MSDGCLMWTGRNKNLQAVLISSNDKEIMQYLHDNMCVGNKLYELNNAKNYLVRYRNQEAINFMKQHGLVERKSLIVQFPNNIPNEVMPDFIRGYFDGNGSMILSKTEYNVYGQVSFAIGSKDFADGLSNKLKNYGVQNQIYVETRHTSYYLRVTKRSEIEKFYNLIYKDKTIFLNRKHDKFLELFSHELKYDIA